MKRTINYTGRKKLTLDQAVIRLTDAPGQIRSFSAEFPGIEELKLPPESRIYVEPYAKSSLMRFDFGTVSAVSSPDDTTLRDIDVGASVLFDVKIVDESDIVGRILASARHIRPIDSQAGEDNRRSLLPVVSRDLGELVWKLEIEPGARPQLILNSRIPNCVVRLKTDPLLQGAILPNAIAQILDNVLNPVGDGSDEMEWVSDWKIWFRHSSGLEPEEEEDPERRRSMIDRACDSFARQQRFASRTDRLDGEPEVDIND